MSSQLLRPRRIHPAATAPNLRKLAKLIPARRSSQWHEAASASLTRTANGGARTELPVAAAAMSTPADPDAERPVSARFRRPTTETSRSQDAPLRSLPDTSPDVLIGFLAATCLAASLFYWLWASSLSRNGSFIWWPKQGLWHKAADFGGGIIQLKYTSESKNIINRNN